MVVERVDLDFLNGFFIGDGVLGFKMFFLGKLFGKVGLDFDGFVDKEVGFCYIKRRLSF